MFVVCLFVVGAGVFAAYYLRNYWRAVRICLQLKGPAAVPLIGNTTLLLRKDFLTKYVTNACRAYGRCTRVWISIIPAFALFDPLDVQKVLLSQRHTDKSFVYRFLHSFLGTGLLTSNGARWLGHRRAIQPAFRQQVLEKYVAIFAQCAGDMVQQLAAMQQRDGAAAVNVCVAVNDFVLDVLLEAIFGCSEIANDVDFMQSPFRKGYPTLSHRLSRPWFIFDWIYACTRTASNEMAHISKMRKFAGDCVAARQRLNSKGPASERRFCLLDFLLQLTQDSGRGFTLADATEQAITFMLAGQDAVGSALAFAIYLLSRNEKCQRRARREIEQMDRDHPESRGSFSVRHLQRLPYLRQCIEETLRLYPSVPLIARQLGTAIRLGDGMRLPAGSNVLIFPYALHRLEHIYPNPEQFDPDRFDRGQQQPARPACAYLPFSEGSRRCIGDQFAMLELLTMLSAMLRRFDLVAATEQRSVQPVFRVTLRSAGGLRVVLRERSAVQE